MPILSLNLKEIISGITPFKNDTRFGVWYSANGLNPVISGGGVSLSASPVEIGNGIMADNYIQAWVSSTSVLYAYGNNGHFYKITNITSATPTVVDLRSVSQIPNPNAWGLESFTTKVGGEKIYYFMLDKMGQLDPSTDTFDDTFATPFATAIQHPVLRVEDRLFYGDGNYISMLYDDLTNPDPANSTQILDLPKGHNVMGLTTDGDYLIIGAASGNNARLETTIYFWNWKNNSVSWDKTYTIQDTLVSLYTKNGISYMLGNHGFWYFSVVIPPEKVRTDIVGIFGYRGIGEYVGSLLIGQNHAVTSYGKLSPQFSTSRFDIISDLNGDVTSLSSQISNTRLFLSTSDSKMFYADFETQRNCTADVVKTGYLDLGDFIRVDRIDIILTDNLNPNDEIDVRVRATDSGVAGIAYCDFSSISYTSDGAISYAKSTAQSDGALVTDKISIELTLTGTAIIKQIDIYGTKQER